MPHTCQACTLPSASESDEDTETETDEDPCDAAPVEDTLLPTQFGSSRGPEWPQPRASRATGGRQLAPTTSGAGTSPDHGAPAEAGEEATLLPEATQGGPQSQDPLLAAAALGGWSYEEVEMVDGNADSGTEAAAASGPQSQDLLPGWSHEEVEVVDGDADSGSEAEAAGRLAAEEAEGAVPISSGGTARGCQQLPAPRPAAMGPLNDRMSSSEFRGALRELRLLRARLEPLAAAEASTIPTTPVHEAPAHAAGTPEASVHAAGHPRETPPMSEENGARPVSLGRGPDTGHERLEETRQAILSMWRSRSNKRRGMAFLPGETAPTSAAEPNVEPPDLPVRPVETQMAPESSGRSSSQPSLSQLPLNMRGQRSELDPGVAARDGPVETGTAPTMVRVILMDLRFVDGRGGQADVTLVVPSTETISHVKSILRTWNAEVYNAVDIEIWNAEFRFLCRNEDRIGSLPGPGMPRSLHLWWRHQ